jgi:hypothetical protein
VNMVMNFQVDVLWAVMPCKDVVGYHSFGGPCWSLHREDGSSKHLRNIVILTSLHGVTSTWIFTTVKVSNLASHT